MDLDLSVLDRREWAPKPNASWLQFDRYRRCPRLWLLHYGGDRLPEALRAETAGPSKLMPWNAWLGQVVDDVISEILRRWRSDPDWEPDVAQPRAGERGLRAMARARFQEYVRHSQAYRRAWMRDRSVTRDPHLQPIDAYFYGEWPDEDAHLELLGRGETMLRRFLDGGIRERIRAVHPCRWILPAKARPGSVAPWGMVDGVPLYASYDFMLWDGETLTIFDWKTGALDHDSEARTLRQMHLYALWAMASFRLSAEQVRLAPVWLGAGDAISEIGVDPILLEALGTEIREWARMLERLLSPCDWEELEARFPLAEEPWVCRSCAMRHCPGYGRGASS